MLARSAKIGATFYFLWGLLHIAGGAVMLHASQQGADSFVRAQTGNEVAKLAGAPTAAGALGLAAAKEVFAFHSFNLIWLGLLTSGVAVFMNWQNSVVGYWLNLAIVGLVDLGLIVFIVLPGIMPLSNACIGPVLFVLAVVFSTIGKLAPA